MGSRRTCPERARGRGRHLGSHRRAHVNAAAPVEGLANERERAGAASAEDDRADRHAGRVLPSGIDGWALRGRRGEAGVRVSRLGAGLLGDFGCPFLPCQSMHSSGGSSVMPSHQTPPSGVRPTFVKMVFFARAAMALGLVLAEVPGATPKKPVSGIDGANAAVWHPVAARRYRRRQSRPSNRLSENVAAG